MTSKVSIIMASHLSDVQIEMDFNAENAKLRLNFVKWLINRYPNTSEEIDPEDEFDEFQEHFGLK